MFAEFVDNFGRSGSKSGEVEGKVTSVAAFLKAGAEFRDTAVLRFFYKKTNNLGVTVVTRCEVNWESVEFIQTVNSRGILGTKKLKDARITSCRCSDVQRSLSVSRLQTKYVPTFSTTPSFFDHEFYDVEGTG